MWLRVWLGHLLIVILSFPQQEARILNCFQGTRVYTPRMGGPAVCVPCPQDHFMPEYLHSHRNCYPCTTIEDPLLEILVSPCDTTHDTEIHCIDGYYRTKSSDPQDRGHCQRCTECRFPKRPCQKLHDTVCCPGDRYGLYSNKNGDPQCVRECGRGQFLDLNIDQCLPCPHNTYMEETKHIHFYCKNCEHPTPGRERIVHACNSTHPTVIDCVDGYSAQHSSEPETGRPQCLKLCGPGQYLDSQTQTCLTCHQNTYMDENRHSHTDRCKPCPVLTSEKERIVQPCNSTHPALIGCVEGFYRQLSGDLSTPTCVQCRNCSTNIDGNIYEGRGCGETRNTVCCSRKGMTVVEALGGPLCLLLSTVQTDSLACGEGKYVSTTASNGSATCQPCPRGTYMDETQHSHSWCKSCDQFPRDKYCPVDQAQHVRSGGHGLDTTIALLVTMPVLASVTLGVILYVRAYRRRNQCRGVITRKDQEENISLISKTTSGAMEENVPAKMVVTMNHCVYKLITDIFAQRNNIGILYLVSSFSEMTKLLAGLTVLVKVKGRSQKRPRFYSNPTTVYPYSGVCDRNQSHTGSGWVERVQLYEDRSCPCVKCQRSAQPVMKWGTVTICTAASVVFDETEGRNCQCYFFYDTDDTDVHSCPSLEGAWRVVSDMESDWCYMAFVTHDLEMPQKLQRMVKDYQTRRSEVRELYRRLSDKNTKGKQPLVFIFSHPKGGPRTFSLGEVKSFPQKDGDTYTYTNLTNTGCEGARVFIFSHTGTRDFGHSRRVGQLGLSGAWSDTSPDTDDLSIAGLQDKKT